MDLKNKPRFIIIEGRDGIGKTFLINNLSKRLESQNIDFISVREPGGTPIGEALRECTKKYDDIGKLAQVQLFNASRIILFKDVIEKALMEGKTVICDRNFLSTIVYEEVLGDEVKFAKDLFGAWMDVMINIIVTTDDKDKLNELQKTNTQEQDHLDKLDQNEIDQRYRKTATMWEQFIGIGSAALVNLTYDQDTDVDNVINVIETIEGVNEEYDTTIIPKWINDYKNKFEGGEQDGE